MQRTTWKTCLDGTLATTLSWISKVPDLTKWGKKYDIFLSSLNNSRQNLNPPARRKSSSMSRTFASNEFELLSPASSFAILVWWPFHLNIMNQMRKNYLQLDWLFGERSSRPGHSQDPGKPLRLKGGWRVGECLDLDGWMGLDGWMVVTSCDRLRSQLPGEIWSKSTLALSACWQVDDGSWGSWSCKQRCSQPGSWSCQIGSVSR